LDAELRFCNKIRNDSELACVITASIMSLMHRRQLLSALLLASAAPLLTATRALAQAPTKVKRLMKTKAEWKSLLSPEQYQILFEEGTERAGTSALNQEKRKGTFVCAACFFPLFTSDKKYESGTGWPSFFDVIPDSVATKRDFKMFLPRTEYHCARCGGHQGHVFDDGPKPTGLRYCNNGLAILFVADGEKMPELRT
jgi:peptide-methionine (R)-S-oxide reductase